MTIQEIKPQILCAIPLRDSVVFPQMTTTILVGREKSINGVEEAKRLGAHIFVVLQTNPDLDYFEEKNIYKTGVICKIIESIKTVDGTLKVIIQGLFRAEIRSTSNSQNYFTCEVNITQNEKFIPDAKNGKEVLGLIKGCVENFSKYAAFNKRISSETLASLVKVGSPYDIAHIITAHLNSKSSDKQKIIEENNLTKKLYKVFEALKTEIEIVQSEIRINKSIQDKIAKANKDLYLNEQLKNIRKELGQDE